MVSVWVCQGVALNLHIFKKTHEVSVMMEIINLNEVSCSYEVICKSTGTFSSTSDLLNSLFI